MIIEDITRATGLGFCFSQLPVFIMAMLYYKEPHTIAYTTKITNVTTMTAEVLADEYGIAVGFLLVSALCVVFSLMTTQLQEAQFIDNMAEFTEETAAQVHMWSATLWAVVIISHLNMVALLCSPVDTFFLLLVVMLQTYSIQVTCSPKTHGKKTDTVSLILYMLMIVTVYSVMHSKHGLKLIFWTAQIMADILLMVGHTYDAHPNTETISNSRVFYCCAVSAISILLYVVE